jgi:hypothetical protein
MTDKTDKLVFHTTSHRLREDGDNLIIRRQQEIPDQFWENAARLKHIQDSKPVGEFLQVATIPEAVVEQWYRDGFNIFDKNVSIPEVLRRLRAEDLNALITTSRDI